MSNVENNEDGPSRDSIVMLGALQGRAIYGGTVDPQVVADRRAANRRARRSRRANRRGRK